MNILKLLSFFIIIFCADMSIFAQSDSLVLKDLVWDNDYPAGTSELFIPSASVLLAGMIYKPNGNEKHPTLILLHGFPGMRKILILPKSLEHTDGMLYILIIEVHGVAKGNLVSKIVLKMQLM